MSACVMRRLAAAVPAAFFVIGSVGCDVNRYVTPERLECGVTFVVPGIGGVDPAVHDMLDGLADGLNGRAVQVFDWSVHVPLAGYWFDLVDYDRNRRKAGELAKLIAEYRVAHPGRPVNLVGHSAGAGIALFALEACAPEVRVDNLVLLSAAVSHDYDMSAALRHVDGRVVSFHSGLDPIVSLGTRMFGSVDRKWCACGGNGGFHLAEDAAPDARSAFARLEQVGWTAEMIPYGNWGGHLGTFSRGFTARWVAPILATPRATADSPQRKPT